MKIIVIPIMLFFCVIQITYSQAEDGVVALDVPVRNSMMFNRFEVNPTFSFVREQNKHITVTNKREHMEIEDAPQTYLFNYSGRFRENIGAGIGVFQQNYGVLTTFGGIVNFAYNVRIQEESNLTFGINIGAYKSGLDSGKVITNFPDPSIDNVPSNFLITVNPGLNYGTGFMDFGVALNNIVTYNFSSSALIEENPKQGIQGHIMYTGYLGGYGFFGESRFSALGRSEFQTDASIFSGVLMLAVPKGIWTQVGYNTMYGASGGLGVNITRQFAIEYNFEKSFMGLSELGPAHEITLAYRFKNNNHYDYSRDDETAGLFTMEKKRNKKKTVSKVNDEPETLPKLEPEKIAIDSEEKERIAPEEQLRLNTEEKAKLAAAEEARLKTEEQEKLAAAEQTRLKAEEQERLAAVEQTRLKTEELAIIAAAEESRLKTEEQARLAAEEQARLEAVANSAEDLIKNPIDNIGVAIIALTEQSEASKTEQSELLKKLEVAVASKEKDLKNLKKENDLSEQDIFVEPRPFKSISEENKAIAMIRINLDTVILRQKKRIIQLGTLLADRVKTVSNPTDATNLYYLNELTELKAEQARTKRYRESLVSTLEQISVATDFERKRRIKRASFDNDQDRYLKDRARLNSLREHVAISKTPLSKEDFNFGDELSNNIQILKNVENTEDGYYMVLAVHNDVMKRDEFLSKVISTGFEEVDFFYDVKTSEYYIYSNKFNSIEEANHAIRTKDDKVYNENLSIIKIEN